jgi:hypothetical protein
MLGKKLAKVLGLSLAILFFSIQIAVAATQLNGSEITVPGKKSYVQNHLFKIKILSQKVNLRKAEVVRAEIEGDCLFRVKVFRKNRGEPVWVESFKGVKSFIWNGKDSSGKLVSNGEYLVLVEGERGGLNVSEVFSVEVNNNREGREAGEVSMALTPTETPLASVELSEGSLTESEPEVAVSYPGAFVAAIEGRVASRFVPQISGKLVSLRLGFSGENIKVYLREDDGGKPGEIIATFDYPSGVDYPYITLKEVDVSQSSVYLEAGKPYWIEGPGVALYSNYTGVTYDWAPWSGVWYNTGWENPFAMEIYVQR